MIDFHIRLRIEQKKKYQVSILNSTIGTIIGEPFQNRLHGRDENLHTYTYSEKLVLKQETIKVNQSCCL